jgi:hypothetical protein
MHNGYHLVIFWHCNTTMVNNLALSPLASTPYILVNYTNFVTFEFTPVFISGSRKTYKPNRYRLAGRQTLAMWAYGLQQ